MRNNLLPKQNINFYDSYGSVYLLFLGI